jgi:tRNA threonylcarbamoyladenosine biosynthesis protein TsaB
MLLAVDTSTAQIGLALYDGSQVISEYAWRSSQRHTVELAPAVSDLLRRCGLTIENIRGLGVALGPGSFTSLRVGLSLVKGIALARGLPLVGIPTLDILAAAQPASKFPLAALIQAGRGRLAVGWYKYSKKGWQAQGPARVMTFETLIADIKKPAIVCGELTAKEYHELEEKTDVYLASPAQSVRRPAILAELAWESALAGNIDDAATLAPIYLHVAEPNQA